jgi:hypothetical protein
MINGKKADMPAIALQRKSEAYDKIQTKIAALRDFRRNGVPEGAFIPTSLEQFRTWRDEQRNLREIGSKSTLYQSCYQKERVEILNLIKLLTQPKAEEQTNESRRPTETRKTGAQVHNAADRGRDPQDSSRTTRRAIGY